jgi:hypothetical protein
MIAACREKPAPGILNIIGKVIEWLLLSKMTHHFGLKDFSNTRAFKILDFRITPSYFRIKAPFSTNRAQPEWIEETVE